MFHGDFMPDLGTADGGRWARAGGRKSETPTCKERARVCPAPRRKFQGVYKKTLSIRRSRILGLFAVVIVVVSL